jgi:hypothetical protein
MEATGRTKRAVWAGLCAAGLLLALPGCKQAEDLEARTRAAEVQLEAAEQLRATRDAQLQALKQLQIAEARLSQQLSPPTTQEVAQAFAALPGLRLVPEADGSAVVTGKAPLAAFGERLEALGRQQPGVGVAFLRVDGEALEARLQVGQLEEMPPSPRPSPIGQVLPWNRERLAKLRAVEARLAEVRAALPPQLEGRAALQWRVGALQELATRAADSRAHALAAATALASGAAPLMTELDLQRGERGWLASGRPRQGVGVAELQRALAPAFAVSRAEPLGGVLRLAFEAQPQAPAAPAAPTAPPAPPAPPATAGGAAAP